jgi:hypothetical protein
MVPLMDVVPLLRSVLERYVDDVEVVRYCAGCFGNLALHVDNRLSLIDVAHLVRSALERHEGDADVAHYCAGFFATVSSRESGCCVS